MMIIMMSGSTINFVIWIVTISTRVVVVHRRRRCVGGWGWIRRCRRRRIGMINE